MALRQTRYWSDSEFREAIEREKARARKEADAGGWITYAIHDPTTPDTIGSFNTMIVYVGQSKQFGVRVDKRLRNAGTAVKRPTDRIDGALWDVMSRGAVPRFRVIERVNDALASFVSETNWCLQYIEEGYPLRNKWKEQRSGASRMDRYSVPHKWLWRLAVEDAIEANFDLIVRSKTKAQEEALDLSVWEPKRLLREVKNDVLNRMEHIGHQASVEIFVR